MWLHKSDKNTYIYMYISILNPDEGCHCSCSTSRAWQLVLTEADCADTECCVSNMQLDGKRDTGTCHTMGTSGSGSCFSWHVDKNIFLCSSISQLMYVTAVWSQSVRVSVFTVLKPSSPIYVLNKNNVHV